MNGSDWTGVVTWHQGRCGSSVLGSLLNQHSQIQAANEIFSRYMPRRWGDRPVPPMQQVLQQTLAERSKPVLNIEIKGLQAQNRSLYPDRQLNDWLELLHRQGFRRQVVLHRRHGLRRLVSHLMAQRSGVFVQSVQAPVAVQEPLLINTAAIREGAASHDLVHWLDLYASTHQELLDGVEHFCVANGLPAPLQLIYEDVIEADPRQAYQQVCRWLGLEPEPVSIQQRRINPEPLPQLIANWDEIERLLAPTPHAWMLAP